MTAHVALTVLDTGYCIARSSFVARGTGWQEIRCHAPAFLIRHPERGAMLFDTGYAPRLLDAFAHWPDRLYKYATPTTLGMPALLQLERHGVTGGDVHTVIVSHLHADHVAGLHDYPRARFVIARAALALQQSVRGIDAVRRGILQRLFPADFAARAQAIDRLDGTPMPYLGATHDLFGDGSVQLVGLPGHARGQLGALVRTDRGPVLLCADGAWTSQAYREQRAPHPITALMQDDMGALSATLRALQSFATTRPEVTILPTHCPETLHWGRDP
ncbi:MAG: MBL fold metallo-hydrolase [Gemmatimonadaceae bacterium]|nr:MBL fold metallo-hydrolase [Gemmatimonadaceae bacterium]